MKLKRRLQIRFVFLAVAALTVMQLVIVGTSLGISYRRMSLRADQLIRLIDTDPDAAEIGDARYFTVVKTEAGLSADVSHTALVTRQKALEDGRRVLASGADRGYVGDYRFLVHREAGEIRINFLSCMTVRGAFRSSARLLCAVSLIGIGVMAFLLTLVSSRVVEPLVRNRQKQREFITSAGHALKTPLAVIQADAQMLESEAGESEWLTDILFQTRRMTELTQRLVYLSRLEEQEERPNHSSFVLSELAQQVCDSFRGLAWEHGRTYEVDICPDICFCGDEKAIREMLNVLLDNACKYTPEGGKIDFHLERTGQNVRIQVENTAKNLRKEQLDRLTGRFNRGTDTSGGFGIGLSVASAVAQRHRGKMNLELTETDRFRVNVVLRSEKEKTEK